MFWFSNSDDDGKQVVKGFGNSIWKHINCVEEAKLFHRDSKELVFQSFFLSCSLSGSFFFFFSQALASEPVFPSRLWVNHISIQVICFCAPTAKWNQIEPIVWLNQYLILNQSLHTFCTFLNAFRLILLFSLETKHKGIEALAVAYSDYDCTWIKTCLHVSAWQMCTLIIDIYLFL